MKYMGSKNRIAKDICRVIEREISQSNCGLAWVEPFVGGGNMLMYVSEYRRKIASDINKYAIDALISIRDHVAELPKTNKDFTEDNYKQLRSSCAYRHKGYAGFALSYGGKWMGGWCRDKTGKRDYVNESYRNALKQSPYLQNVELSVGDYKQIETPYPSVIYCDPPYFGTTKYSTGVSGFSRGSVSGFNHTEFFEWCRMKASEGHYVFISEYEAPDDFKCLWSKEITSSLTANTGHKKGIEKLFTLHG